MARLSFLVPSLLLLILGCGELLTLRVSSQAETRVEGAGALGAVLGEALALTGWEGLDVALEEELVNQGVERGDITEARLERLLLSSPDGTLDFLEAITVEVACEALPRTRVAHADAIPEGTRQVELTLDEVDLAPCLVEESLSFFTTVQGRAPEQDTTVTADVTLAVGVTAQGACSGAGAGG
jgi:hypothetical protein